ncbi:MAG: hypothetical protein RMN51_11690 [Verrucomicrobiota bacterium]|nr:hypothetical protein [Limisphaera sp.]MDW8382752.1 hypothetical protein [Verrucomicrobiota bacterium]
MVEMLPDRQVPHSFVPRGKVAEALIVSLFIQAFILLGLAWGEFPGGTSSVLGGLAACYLGMDITVWLIGVRSRILSRRVVRIGLYLAQPVVCVGYGVMLNVLR